MRAAFVLLLIGVFTRTAICAETCTGPGKFIADYNCTSYVACLENAGGGTEYPSYTVKCPTGFYVRISDLVCFKAEGVCAPTYTCTGLGNFTNPSNNSASAYISCIQGVGTMIIASVMKCPDSNFNSNLGHCEEATSTSVTPAASTTTIEAVAVAGTAGSTAVSETTSITPAVAAQPSSTSNVATEAIPNIFTTTTQKVGTHRVNGSAHIYSSHILIVIAVISALFCKQH